MLPYRRPIFASLTTILLLVTPPFASANQTLPRPSVERSAPSAMTIYHAVVLGIVEGLTEYLPVSSTGHLLLTQRAMGISQSTSIDPQQRQSVKDAAHAYTICIQAGAILAVLGLYVTRVRQILMGLVGRDPAGLKLMLNITAGFVPAAVTGLLFADFIKEHLFGPWSVVLAWFLGGVAILAVVWWHKIRGQRPQTGKLLEELNWRMALGIGFAQCVAMWPGVSRSLVTIVSGVLIGLALPAAVEFSFLLGAVTLGAATCHDGIRHGQIMLETFDPLFLTVGLLVAFLSAVLAVKWMVAYLNRHGLGLFGYYRVALAAVVAVLLMCQVV